VEVVIIEPDGSLVQQRVDMTPKKDTASQLLGGTPTFLGQYEDNPEVQSQRLLC